VIELGEEPNKQSWAEFIPSDEDMAAVEDNAKRMAMEFNVRLSILDALNRIAGEMTRINDYVIGGQALTKGVVVPKDVPKRTVEESVIPPPRAPVPIKSSPTEDVVQAILKARPQLGRDTITRLIDEERARAAGLLTEEAAAHLVAENLGVFGDEDPEALPIMKLPENVESDSEIIEFYRTVMHNARSRDGEPLPERVLNGLDIKVFDDRVELRTPWLGDGDDRQIGRVRFAVIGEALRQYGGQWVSDKKESHWLLPHP